MDRRVSELIASIDPLSIMRRVAEDTCVLIPNADGAAINLCEPNGDLVVVSAHGLLTAQLGTTFRLKDTFQAVVLRRAEPTIVDDVMGDPRLTSSVRELGTRLGVRSCLSIPLLHDAEILGTLTVVAAAAHAFDEDAVSSIASTSRLIAAVISNSTDIKEELRLLLEDYPLLPATDRVRWFVTSMVTPEVAVRDQLRSEVDAMLRPEALEAHFQPIVDLEYHRVVGFEGLCWFPGGTTRRTEEWFELAHQVELGVELELAALATILRAARRLPAVYALNVNLSPAAVCAPEVQRLLLADRRSLTLELTEHQPAPQSLAGPLQVLRDKGIRLAVDDAGARFAGLTHIVRLRPDVIKLDAELTVDIQHEPVRRALATAIVQFASQIGAITVAEGIETSEQCRVLRDLGIELGQGYFLGRPRPIGEVLARPISSVF